mmetsp:Transcript_25710/g.60500  ORF Transcript_25710/g.60500 Transcript_25710/m.60500 type:complete len:820 (-) Transcript_25710:226-2685(-)|eukprot:CAMPEP_0168732888 /NCGR_PEP_ID=MMETSP0724-20121128/7998_1 /TAXON_ID=265536 /ORGANISM="Amphiprora sp., Strain CCMP467" /LENGTH=819 /DNA_ID=CAMNT_0008779911 /DNA_START=247 /DNA_END=2706 /DNA_ORIENTATION=-
MKNLPFLKKKKPSSGKSKSSKPSSTSKSKSADAPDQGTPSRTSSDDHDQDARSTDGQSYDGQSQDGSTTSGQPTQQEPAAPPAKKGPKKERTDNIFSTAIDMKDEFEAKLIAKTDADVKFIDQALEDNFIFASLTDEERRMMINAMESFEVPPGSMIIKQGTTGDYFYVLAKGQVSFVVDKQHVGSIGPGGSFGELALLYNCPRGASCLAESACKLWRVDQKTFRFMLANNSSAQQKDVNETLRKVPFLSDLQDMDLNRIADALSKVNYEPGDRIINKGDVGKDFYIIREGRVKVHDIGFGGSTYKDQEMGVGEFFGERALLTGDPRMANITAVTNVVCLALSRETFELVLGPLQDSIDRAQRKRTLLGVPAIADSQFAPHELARLTDRVKEVEFPPGTILAEEGKPYNHCLYIIRTGSVMIASAETGMLTKSDADYFGDDSIKLPDDAPSKYTISVQEETSCGVLTKPDMERIVGPIHQRLGRPPADRGRKGPDIRFKDLVKFRILGVGTFGKVWLVSHKRSGTPFALKVLGKREVIGHHQVEGVMREKNLMAAVKHPFVVDLVTCFQDERNLYMLIGLVQGGELFSIIHTEVRDGIPNGNSRFYAACILESLAALHRQDICYRDLKPENVLIDRRGYCVLVDLGFAKVVTDKTFTLCGTPEYLSPEIILSKGHDKGADYWAFGVLIYEMLVGFSPFYSHDMDQVGLFKRIVGVKYGFPHGGLVQDVVKHLISRLLQRRPADRLGCLSRGDQDIRDHKWFHIINTQKLLNKQIPPPWVPRLKDPLDATHFDSYAHLENEPPPTYPPPTREQQLLFKDF